MGRPSAKKGPTSEKAAQQEPEGEQEQAPVKLNLYDQASLKASLDDTAKFVSPQQQPNQIASKIEQLHH